MEGGTAFGGWLKQQREAHALTQEQLAGRIGCATVTLRKIEADTRRPSKQIAELLAETFGVPAPEREAFVRFARGETRSAAPPLDLAPWRAPDHRLPHLPLPSTPLLGRAEETAYARALLLDDRVRLLTLTGVGGIGKTRLALQLANDLSDEFQDGTHFVDLASIADPALVIPTIARAFALHERGNLRLFNVLTNHLLDKRLLLVLDNFEQIIPAAPQIGEMLATCPKLQIVATSREVLGLSVEQGMVVQPLALPNGARLSPEAMLAKYPSVALFEQRALAVKPDFAVTTKNAQAVAQVCRHLDGIPLAIELAAARVKILSVHQINARLDKRYRLLTAAIGMPPPRHQTLRAAMDWSYELLSDAEKALFARLSVFVGGWTVEAAEAIANPKLQTPNAQIGSWELEVAILDLLTQLVDKSLVIVNADSDEPRFRMLETIREYALERLMESDDLARTRQRHLEYFLGLAEEAEPKLSGADQVPWLERLDREEDNLRAALQWTVGDGGNAELALRFVSALSRFWYTRNYWDEPYERLLGILQAQSTGARTFLRGKALFAVADLATSLEDFENAHMLFDEGIEILRELGQKSRPLMEEALTHYAWATVYRDLSNAHRYGEEAARLSRESGNKPGLAASLNVLMLYSLFTCDFDSALKFLEESAATYKELGDQRGFAAALGNIGATYYFQNDLIKAEEILNRSLAIQREIGDKRNTIATLFHLGNIARIRGQNDAAESLFQQARGNLGGDAGKAANARILMFLGRLQLTQGNFSQAAQHARESLSSFREMNQLVRYPSALENFAFIASALKEPHRAAHIFGAAQALREKLGTPVPLVERAEYETYLTAARARLDESAFAAAWDEGRAMRLEQAIDYALEANDDQ